VTPVEHPSSSFLWPNDLRFGPDGHFFLTDTGVLDTVYFSGLSINPEYETMPIHGTVYEMTRWQVAC
jgi:gluconolactonase